MGKRRGKDDYSDSEEFLRGVIKDFCEKRQVRVRSPKTHQLAAI